MYQLASDACVPCSSCGYHSRWSSHQQAPFFRCFDTLAAENGTAGDILSVHSLTHQLSNVSMDALPCAVVAPAAVVVMHREPRWIFLWQHAPRTAAVHQIEDAVGNQAQRPLSWPAGCFGAGSSGSKCRHSASVKSLG
jgi:hypothetical protein